MMMLNERNWNSLNKNLKKKKITVIDNFLKDQIAFTLQQRMVHTIEFDKIYNRYGSMLYNRSDNLTNQIATELEENIPCLKNSFVRAWAFIYDNKGAGVKLHADPSQVNINIWVTPNKSINNPQLNGLNIFNIKPPKNWTRKKWNTSPELVSRYIKTKNKKPFNIKYKYNRAVFFDGALFHASDETDMKEGIENQKVSYTMLFGRSLE
jgi:hypothetical protein